MKIGLVCPYDIAKGSGVKEVVLALQSRLSLNGHDICIITPQTKLPSGFSKTEFRFVGLQKDIKYPLKTTAQISVSFDSTELDELLRYEKFDILNFHEPWVPYLSRQILIRSKAINIATFHAKIPETVIARSLARIVTPYTKSILKYFQALSAVSAVAAEYVTSLTDRKVVIIPNGVDVSKYQRKNSENRSKSTILYVGRVEARKGLKYLLYAYHQLRNTFPEVELIVAGEGSDLKEIKQFAIDLNIGQIQFLGAISEAEKISLMHTSTVMCCPSIYGESFGIVLLEGMAAGIPLVAGSNSGYRTVLSGIGDLSLVDPTDVDALARRLELFLFNTDLRSLWLKWSHHSVKKFDFSHIANQYELLYLHTPKLSR